MLLLSSAARAFAEPPRHLFAEAGTPEESDDALDEAAGKEREYVRRVMRESLGREPTDEEIDEWLRQHTEGY